MAVRASRYRPELDAIRGVAIFLVLIDHMRAPGLQYGGIAGVTLFFVLSGYLITGLLMEEQQRTGRVSLRAFYERRIRRLIPALLVVVAAVGVILLALGRGTEYPAGAAVVLGYVANMSQDLWGIYPPLLGHAWSLSLEEQFYTLWPVMFIFLPRRFLVLGLIAFTVYPLFHRWELYGNHTRGDWWIDARGDALAWGVLLAIRGWRFPKWAGWFAASVLAFVVVSPHLAWPGALTVVALCAVILVGSSTWRHPAFVWLGTISYGLYLWHAVIFGLFDPILRGSHGPLVRVTMQVALSALALAVAVLSEQYVERPFRRSRLRDANERGVDHSASAGPALDGARA